MTTKFHITSFIHKRDAEEWVNNMHFKMRTKAIEGDEFFSQYPSLTLRVDDEREYNNVRLCYTFHVHAAFDDPKEELLMRMTNDKADAFDLTIREHLLDDLLALHWSNDVY